MAISMQELLIIVSLYLRSDDNYMRDRGHLYAQVWVTLVKT